MEVESSDSITTLFLQIHQPNILYLLKFIFRTIGICTNKTDRQYFKYSMAIFFFGLLIIFFSSVIHSIKQYSSGDKFQFQVVGVQIWMIYGTISYGIISYHMLNDYNIFSFLEYISQPENHHYGKTRTKTAQKLTTQNLNRISSQWVGSACGLILLSVAASLITFGPTNLLSKFLPLFHNPADNLFFIFLFVTNLVSPLPMVIVRLGSYFLEQRVLGMVLFLESEVDELHTIHIQNLMEWYDDLYHYNEILTFYLSPYITLSLLITFPQTIFLLQGFLMREGDYVEGVTLCIWFGISALTLLITTSSVAQLDALNRRIEIALGTIVSRDLFASKETCSKFDLALAKQRSLPFGVFFYATRARVSYSAIYKISSLIISVFFFFAGYS